MKLFKSCEEGVHQFEARYNIIPPALSDDMTFFPFSGYPDMIKAGTKKTYIHDICVKCGKIVRQS